MGSSLISTESVKKYEGFSFFFSGGRVLRTHPYLLQQLDCSEVISRYNETKKKSGGETNDWT